MKDLHESALSKYAKRKTRGVITVLVALMLSALSAYSIYAAFGERLDYIYLGAGALIGLVALCLLITLIGGVRFGLNIIRILLWIVTVACGLSLAGSIAGAVIYAVDGGASVQRWLIDMGLLNGVIDLSGSNVYGILATSGAAALLLTAFFATALRAIGSALLAARNKPRAGGVAAFGIASIAAIFIVIGVLAYYVMLNGLLSNITKLFGETFDVNIAALISHGDHKYHVVVVAVTIGLLILLLSAIWSFSFAAGINRIKRMASTESQPVGLTPILAESAVVALDGDIAVFDMVDAEEKSDYAPAFVPDIEAIPLETGCGRPENDALADNQSEPAEENDGQSGDFGEQDAPCGYVEAEAPEPAPIEASLPIERQAAPEAKRPTRGKPLSIGGTSLLDYGYSENEII